LQHAAFQIKSVQSRNHFGHIFSRSQFHKSETTGTAGFRITDHARRGDLKPITSEQLIQTLIRCIKREVSYVELRHGSSPFGAPQILKMLWRKNGRVRIADPPQ
jgi:hypothetical protein